MVDWFAILFGFRTTFEVILSMTVTIPASCPGMMDVVPYHGVNSVVDLPYTLSAGSGSRCAGSSTQNIRSQSPTNTTRNGMTTVKQLCRRRLHHNGKSTNCRSEQKSSMRNAMSDFGP
jgi:hypothetical protein